MPNSEPEKGWEYYEKTQQHKSLKEQATKIQQLSSLSCELICLVVTVSLLFIFPYFYLIYVCREYEEGIDSFEAEYIKLAKCCPNSTVDGKMVTDNKRIFQYYQNKLA